MILNISTFMDAESIESLLSNLTDAWNIPQFDVIHKCFDTSYIKGKVGLPIGLIEL